MKVQFITSPTGEEMAVLARADYDALAALAAETEEDMADIALFEARKAETSPLLPQEVSARLLRGESLLKAVRNWRDMTQKSVAENCNVNISQGSLSDLESGRRKGDPETLAKLAEIYDVPRAWFV